MKLRLNTSICPIVDVGMYGSFLDPQHIFEFDEYEIYRCDTLTEEEKEYCSNSIYMNFDTAAYKQTVAIYATEVIEDLFNDIRGTIEISLCEGASIYSPKFYNFDTDQLEFDVEISSSEIIKIIVRLGDEQFSEKFFGWARENYKSHSGFYSFMPCEPDGYTVAIEGQDLERALSMYLSYLLRDCIDESQCYIADKIVGNCSLCEFVDDKKFAELYERAVC